MYYAKEERILLTYSDIIYLTKLLSDQDGERAEGLARDFSDFCYDNFDSVEKKIQCNALFKLEFDPLYHPDIEMPEEIIDKERKEPDTDEDADGYTDFYSALDAGIASESDE